MLGNVGCECLGGWGENANYNQKTFLNAKKTNSPADVVGASVEGAGVVVAGGGGGGRAMQPSHL